MAPVAKAEKWGGLCCLPSTLLCAPSREPLYPLLCDLSLFGYFVRPIQVAAVRWVDPESLQALLRTADQVMLCFCVFFFPFSF